MFFPFADIYRTNMFHLAVGGCALVLQKDLEYWGIDELMMEPCCALKYYPEIEICHNEKQVGRCVGNAYQSHFGCSCFLSLDHFNIRYFYFGLSIIKLVMEPFLIPGDHS